MPLNPSVVTVATQCTTAKSEMDIDKCKQTCALSFTVY